MAPPASAATTLTPVEIAPWSENSSLRCSARLCSVMNGDWTTEKALVGGADERGAGDHGERGPDQDQADDPDRGHARRQDEHEPASDPIGKQARRETPRAPRPPPMPCPRSR
jgi:hypothetical protein